MATITEKILPRQLEDEMRDSYIDYSMSVIVSRALPDVRDGLKPVHRRVLYGMNELGLAPNRPYKKSARVVGEVLGKYHPHGDTAVYDTIVRMAQDFSMRYPLVQGQGNFGSVDGDSPAAMRYTEARMTPLAIEMLRDLEKETVDFGPNFDETLQQPLVMPAGIPNLLVNGSTGIAVGMATNIPPHNLTEVINACLAYIKNHAITSVELMKIISAPDFPTGGIIYGYDGVRDAYTTGRGRVIVRARATIETQKNDREHIVVTELPYQVNKANLIEKMAEFVRDKKLEGISDIRDESDKDGLRVVIELKRDAVAKVVLNNLYKHTQMQTTFGVIMLSLVKGVPRVLELRSMIKYYIEHRNDVVLRRTKYDLSEAEKRAHILEGYIIALDNIDAVIQTIKKSKDVDTAQKRLMAQFKLSEIQSKAILEMRLQRLTGLERDKIQAEYRDLIQLIEKLKAIIASPELQMKIIGDELAEIKKKYGDERRTEIVYDTKDFTIEDMIAEEDVVVTISHQGFIKRFPVSGYRRQGRGGKGITGAATREDDFLEHMFIASTHHYIMFFTDRGRCYWLKVHEVPEAGRTSKGRSIANLLEKPPEERITAFINVKQFDEAHFVTMVTEHGTIKKTVLSAFGNIRRAGVQAITLDTKDSLKDVRLTNGQQEIIIGTHEGMACRFNEKDVRDMGRTAAGVRGVRLDEGDHVIGMISPSRSGTTVLVVSEEGYGKRSEVSDYRLTRRGGKGVITMKATEKTGKLVAIKEVVDNDDLICVTKDGLVIRQHVAEIRVMGRNTQGVRVVRLNEGDRLAAVANVPADEDKEIDEALPEITKGKTPPLPPEPEQGSIFEG
ncbi:MAG: DNA gyrase subunit A [Bacteroidota bacterium]|nr:DNA gyrase subunit A [Bacteroidota bacterium]MDP4234445.1 DNA gyrase subunit A [Bacteroidota bacterium]MDP4288177.1 DNA gyrase subunit A [Bacteroidota bacterium]